MGLRRGRHAGPLPARILGCGRGGPRPRARAGRCWTRSTCPPFAAGLLRADGPGPDLLPQVRLDGLDTMRFRHRGPAPARGCGGGRRRGRRLAGGLPGDGRPAAGRRLHRGRSDAGTDWFDLGITVSVEGRGAVRRPVRGAGRAARGTCCSPTAPTSRSTPRAAAAAGADRRGPRAAGRARRSGCGSAGSRPGCGRSSPSSGWSSEQAQALARQVGRCWRLDAIAPARPARRRSRAQLRPYQLDGFHWLASSGHGLGGVLADDMGLGKTVQTLALICHAHEQRARRAPLLVVAPTSVVSTGRPRRRASRRAAVVAVTDTRRQRGPRAGRGGRRRGRRGHARTPCPPRRDAYRAAAWAGLVLDEAQFVKNHQAKAYQCVRRLAAPIKLAITGTPMENNLMELWSLLSITAPGLFPDPTGSREHVREADRERRRRRAARPRCAAGSGR